MTDPEPDAARSPVRDTGPAREPEPFGKYWLIDRIAVGGMAEVFRARAFGHAGFAKDLVVKRILRHHSHDPQFVDLFISEAKLSATLVHPNIVQVFDFGRIDDNYFIAMEAVDGKDLKSLLRRLGKRGERTPPTLAAYIAFETARGLDYAHTRRGPDGQPLGLVHRDISPSNLLIGYDGFVKLVDFGIAEVGADRATEGDEVLRGKFSYMCPEQVAGQPVDGRSDQFSLGICLWEMLTGQRLFKAESELETLQRIRACEVPSPQDFAPVPDALAGICLRALSPAPDDRFPDAATLRRALGEALQPARPERLREELSAFVRERFAHDILQERARLEAGTSVAAERHYDGGDLDLDLEPEDERTDPGLATGPAPPPADSTETVAGRTPEPRRRWALALGPLLLLAAFAFWLRAGSPPEATLSVSVLPAGLPGVQLHLDGKPIPATFSGVAPDLPHTLRAEAPGHLPREREIELVAGQTFAVELTLQPLPTPTPTPAPTPTPTPKATPTPGATPTPRATPTPKATPTPRATPEPVQARVTAPKAGASVLVSRRLPETAPPAVIMGKVNVQITPGWAKVFIDGAYVSTTPLIGHELAPGTHELRVLSERLGIDETESVTVRAGETTVKAYSFDR